MNNHSIYFTLKLGLLHPCLTCSSHRSTAGTGHLDRSSAITSCLSDNPTAADSSAWSVTLFKLMPLRRKSRESCYLLDDNDAEMKKISSTILEKQTKVPLLKQATSCLTSRRSRDRSRERDDNRADEEAPGLSKVRRHQPVSKAAGTISEELAKRNMKESDVQIALNHADEGNESSDGEDDYRSGDKAGTTVNMSLGAIDKFHHRFMRKDRNLPSDAVYRGTLGSPISFISEVEIGGKREWQVGKEIIGKDDYADPEEETTVELSMPY